MHNGTWVKSAYYAYYIGIPKNTHTYINNIIDRYTYLQYIQNTQHIIFYVQCTYCITYDIMCVTTQTLRIDQR